MCPSSEFVTVQPRQTRRVLMSEGEGEKFFLKKTSFSLRRRKIPASNKSNKPQKLFVFETFLPIH